MTGEVGACQGGPYRDAGGGQVECELCGTLCRADRVGERQFGFADRCELAEWVADGSDGERDTVDELAAAGEAPAPPAAAG